MLCILGELGESFLLLVPGVFHDCVDVVELLFEGMEAVFELDVVIVNVDEVIVTCEVVIIG